MTTQKKFRAWTGIKMEYNVMTGWLGAFYVQGINPNDSACMSEFNTIYTENVPVMQFTGLLDKNGKEIYEGDILKSLHSYNYCDKYIVAWSDSAACFVVNDPKGDYVHWLSSWISRDKNHAWTSRFVEKEIIGNIYENPELLTNNKLKVITSLVI